MLACDQQLGNLQGQVKSYRCTSRPHNVALQTCFPASLVKDQEVCIVCQLGNSLQYSRRRCAISGISLQITKALGFRTQRAAHAIPTPMCRKSKQPAMSFKTTSRLQHWSCSHCSNGKGRSDIQRQLNIRKVEAAVKHGLACTLQHDQLLWHLQQAWN